MFSFQQIGKPEQDKGNMYHYMSSPFKRGNYTYCIGLMSLESNFDSIEKFSNLMIVRLTDFNGSEVTEYVYLPSFLPRWFEENNSLLTDVTYKNVSRESLKKLCDYILQNWS